MSSSKLLKDAIHADYLMKGNLSVGAKLPTIRELATRYDVSTPTIGRAVEILAAEGWISKKSRSGLYVARSAGGNAPMGQEGSVRIGYIAPSLDTLLAHKALEGVVHVARNRNGILELSGNRQVEEERRQIGLMKARGVQGIVLYPTPERPAHDEYLGREFLDFPIVVIDLHEPDMKRPYVVFDNFSAGREMVRYLLKLGRQHIAFVKFDVARRTIDDRAAGYCRGLEEANLPFVPERMVSYNIQPGLDNKSFREALDKLLSLGPRPDAIILPWDEVVPMAIKHLRSRGVSVPEDIVVAGFDNLPLNNELERWPTTNPDFYRLGERAAEILFNRIAAHNLEPSGLMLSCPLMVPEVYPGVSQESAFPAQRSRSSEIGKSNKLVSEGV